MNHICNVSGWTYVDLHNLDDNWSSWYVNGNIMFEYRAWLEKYVGIQGEEWEYRIGDRYARGVYLKDAQAAIMFKLSFNV